MPVNNEHTHTAANELIGEHQPGWAGSDDKNIRVHLGLQAEVRDMSLSAALDCRSRLKILFVPGSPGPLTGLFLPHSNRYLLAPCGRELDCYERRRNSPKPTR
jgi:hypothetical protein